MASSISNVSILKPIEFNPVYNQAHSVIHNTETKLLSIDSNPNNLIEIFWNEEGYIPKIKP